MCQLWALHVVTKRQFFTFYIRNVLISTCSFYRAGQHSEINIWSILFFFVLRDRQNSAVIDIGLVKTSAASISFNSIGYDAIQHRLMQCYLRQSTIYLYHLCYCDWWPGNHCLPAWSRQPSVLFGAHVLSHKHRHENFKDNAPVCCCGDDGKIMPGRQTNRRRVFVGGQCAWRVSDDVRLATRALAVRWNNNNNNNHSGSYTNALFLSIRLL